MTLQEAIKTLGISHVQVELDDHRNAAEKLRDATVDGSGHLIVLPCGVGDVVYLVMGVYDAKGADRKRTGYQVVRGQIQTVHINATEPTFDVLPDGGNLRKSLKLGDFYLSKDKACAKMREKSSKDCQKKLLHLMEENPDLPVLPLVEACVVGTDYIDVWAGSMAYARVDEYITIPGTFDVIAKSEGDVYEALELYLSEEEFEAMPDDEEYSIAVYNSLPWKKAILVYIYPQQNEFDVSDGDTVAMI
jgi:hypothetical protein